MPVNKAATQYVAIYSTEEPSRNDVYVSYSSHVPAVLPPYNFYSLHLNYYRTKKSNMKAVIIKEHGVAAVADIKEQSVRPGYIKVKTVALNMNVTDLHHRLAVCDNYSVLFILIYKRGSIEYRQTETCKFSTNPRYGEWLL